MAETSANGESFDLPIFRPKKRQKLYRKRADDDDDEKPVAEPGQQTSTSPPTQTLDDLIESASKSSNLPSSIPVASLLRQRQVLQRKRLGIEYSASKANDVGQELGSTEDQIAPAAEQDEEDDMVALRFAPQTGQVVDVADKHMVAYIDAELAKRAVVARRAAQPSDGSEYNSAAHRNLNNEHLDHSIHRQPAALGKIYEIDLGPDARARNIAATQAAQRRFEGDGGEDEGQVEGEGKRVKKRKPRLGRDGKPLPPRRPRRRASEDLKRDKLVEEILKESRISVDLDPTAALAGEAARASMTGVSGETEDVEAADDKIADQFRRDYMEAMSGRRRRMAPTASAKAKQASEQQERLKGPKLGGSRSTRAAMREKELQLQREREKEKRFGKR